MFFSIDPNNGISIYEQIVRQVKFAVADGVLIPGQLLPSVRTLSIQLAINPNTVAKAFQILQSDGICESLRGRGLTIRSAAVEACGQARRTLLEERLRSGTRAGSPSRFGLMLAGIPRLSCALHFCFESTYPNPLSTQKPSIGDSL
jgi:GntR family transcriptional regulator